MVTADSLPITTDTSPPIPDGSHTDSLARAVHRLGDVVPKGDRSSGRVITGTGGRSWRSMQTRSDAHATQNSVPSGSSMTTWSRTRHRRFLPQRLNVGRPAEDRGDRSGPTVHLVGDVDAVGAGPCIAGLRDHGASLPPPLGVRNPDRRQCRHRDCRCPWGPDLRPQYSRPA